MGGLFWVLPGRGTARQGCWRNSRRGLPKKKTAVKANPRSASRLCYGSLRSPPRRREAEPSPQSVTHAVRTNCYLCGEELPLPALPEFVPVVIGTWYQRSFHRRAPAQRVEKNHFKGAGELHHAKTRHGFL